MSDPGHPSSVVGRKHRPKARVLSSGSESSDDSLIVPRKKKARTRVISQSSDSGSEVETRRRRRKNALDKPVIVSESDSDAGSLGDGVACPICLGKLDETTLQGRPESCEHTFCFECIIEWSKNNTTCPLCRNSFAKMKLILKDDVLEELPVKKATPELNEADQFLNDILCLVCHRSDQEDMLLLCDECDDAYHCACLNPPLMSVPPGQWFCPRCSQASIDADSDDDGDNTFVPDDSHSLFLPRTRATERVRRAVQSTRRTATNRRTPRTTGARRRTTQRSSANGRTTTGGRSRKTIKRRKGTRRKAARRRKGGRRLTILRKAYAASTEQQWRIARSLGLSDRILRKLNRNNVSFPVLSTDEPSTSRGTSSRSSESFGGRRPLAGVAPSLNIFGSKNDYEPPAGSSSDHDDDAAGVVDDQHPKGVPADGSGGGGGGGVDFLGGLLEQQSVLLSKRSELKSDAHGTLRLVCGESSTSTAKSTIARRSSAEPTASSSVSASLSTPTAQKSHAPAISRASSSSFEYDVRYKPQRISRVDANCVVMIANTIEDVVRSGGSNAPQLEPESDSETTRHRRHGGESKNSRLSAVPYANEPHNVARASAVKESQGWINSLKLTVPTVINSLSIVQDVDIGQPSCSAHSSPNNHRYVEMKSRYVCVKQEPRESEERTPRQSHYAQHHQHHHHYDQKKRSSHYGDSKHERRRERSADRKSSSRHRRSVSPDRNRNRRKSRSRSPIVVKKERCSRSRSRSASPARCSYDAKSKHRRSRSRSRGERDSYRKDSSLRSVKTEIESSPARATPSERRKTLDSGQTDSATHDRRSNREPDSQDAAAPAVDLSRVKIEPQEYSSPNSDVPGPSSLCDIKIKTEPTVNFEAVDSYLAPSGVAPPAESRISADLPQQPTFATSLQFDVKTTAWMSAESLQRCQSFPTVQHDPAELQGKAEPSENPAATSTTNSSVHIEGYSSGMDSEESSSDVERAAPVVVATATDTKPIAKSEPPKKHVKYFVSRDKFKDAVVKEVGPYLKKFYKKHQISKEDYKEIFKKVVKKVCTSSSEKKRLVCTKAIHKLCHIYVKRARIQIKLDCKFEEEEDDD